MIPVREERRKQLGLAVDVRITDSIREVRRNRLIASQEQSGKETRKKLQGQKRKLQSQKRKLQGQKRKLQGQERSPTKRPQRGSITPTVSFKPVEVTEPKRLGTPSKIPTKRRETRRTIVA